MTSERSHYWKIKPENRRDDFRAAVWLGSSAHLLPGKDPIHPPPRSRHFREYEIHAVQLVPDHHALVHSKVILIPQLLPLSDRKSTRLNSSHVPSSYPAC